MKSGKNRKEYRAAIENAKGESVFTLHNNFQALPVSGFLPVDLELGSLYKNNNTYQLRVHSNCWYEWAA